METILVIEDDPRIQKSLTRLFSSEGYQTRVESDGPSGLAASRDSNLTAVVLDLMLPALSGREVCRSIKSATPALPVIILSAVSEVADKVLLLEIGADDYMTKPFSPRELLARVQAAIRRGRRMERAAPQLLEFGDVTLDLARMEMRKAEAIVPLTAHEFKLLRYFAENPDRVISRQQLLTDVWGYDAYPTTRTVDNQILKLRQKIEANPSEPRYLRTVHGAGYKFVRGG
jgi:DNA-binding response OmpR family regulator